QPMTDEQKREHAEAIKHALGMASPEFGPPMEGEEGWVPSGKTGADFIGFIAAKYPDEFAECMRDAADLWVSGACIPDAAEDADDPWEVLYGDAERAANERAANAQAVI